MINNEDTIIKDIIINGYAKFKKYRLEKREELIKENENFKLFNKNDEFYEDTYSRSSVENINKIPSFSLFSKTLNNPWEEKYNDSVELYNSHMVPDGIFCYPLSENIRSDQSFELKHMIKIDNYETFVYILNNTWSNIKTQFLDFPHIKTENEKIDNKNFLNYIFLKILRSLEKKFIKISINVIIDKLSDILQKNFYYIYKTLSEYMTKLIDDIQLREEHPSSLKNYRRLYCCICFKYTCEEHFYDKNEFSTCSSNFKYKIFKKKIKRKYDDINNIYIKNVENVEMPDYSCDLNETCYRTSSIKIPKSIFENPNYEFDQNEFDNLTNHIDSKELSMLIYLIVYHICFNPCFIHKYIFSLKYKCIDINNIIQEFKSNPNLVKFYIEKLQLSILKVEIFDSNINFKHKIQTIKFNTKRHSNRPEIIPCNHLASCTKNNCECLKKRGFCEKYCQCGVECKVKYPGCECIDGCIKSCQCVIDDRECDTDTCHKYCLECSNNDFNSGEKRKTALSKSIICDNYGLFALEDLKENSFICEYNGEILDREETERRTVFNDLIGLNYLFGITEKSDIDAFRAGSKMRYPNHSSFGYQNCYVKQKYVKGRYRIGLYALRSIKIGEELFFDYNMQSNINWLSKYNRYYSKK